MIERSFGDSLLIKKVNREYQMHYITTILHLLSSKIVNKFANYFESVYRHSEVQLIRLITLPKHLTTENSKFNISEIMEGDILTAIK